MEAKPENWQAFARARGALRASLSRQADNVYFRRNTRGAGRGNCVSAVALGALLLLAATQGVQPSGSAVVAVAIALLALNVLFARLLPAYTMLGRGVLDGIEGLKLAFLGGVDEYGDEHPASRVLAERFLPYAVALEVHNQWSARLERELAKRGPDTAVAGAQPVTYSPAWFYIPSGSGTHPYRSISSFTAHFTSSFNSTISAASMPPGSGSGAGGGGRGGYSGGGGGGYSGGGGGGGGGRGW